MEPDGGVMSVWRGKRGARIKARKEDVSERKPVRVSGSFSRWGGGMGGVPSSLA